jgi:hypothetical protein
VGIDVHGLNFLKYTKKRKPFGDVITIGRQGINVSESVIKDILKITSEYKNKSYCEELLKSYLGATKVESVDNSNYEEASYVHDMNQSLPSNLINKYDTVFDGGCLEHIYNVPQALKNCSLFCKPGGQILHALPANNCCGHGFWQFSPELFFSLYSKNNGYAETEVFIADLTNTKKWYRVKQPTNGRRVNVKSSRPLYVLVRTVLQEEKFNHADVQQSDYVFEWTASNQEKNLTANNKLSIKERIKKISVLHKLLAPIYHFYLKIKINDGLNSRNPNISLIKINDYIH